MKSLASYMTTKLLNSTPFHSKNIIRACRECVILLVLFLSFPTIISAVSNSQDLQVVCAEDGPCDMNPNPGDALFYETNILPGDTFVQNLTVENQDPDNACSLTVETTDHSESPSQFPTQLFTAVKKDGLGMYGSFADSTHAAGNKSLADLYAEQTIYVGAVGAGDTADFEWVVTFDPQAGNEYQLAETLFDFEVQFSCGDAEEAELLLTKTNDHGVDYIDDEDNIEWIDRDGRQMAVVRRDVLTATNIMTVVAQPTSPTRIKVVTAYPGDYAPPFNDVSYWAQKNSPRGWCAGLHAFAVVG